MNVEPYDKDMCRFEQFDFENSFRLVIDYLGRVYEDKVNHLDQNLDRFYNYK